MSSGDRPNRELVTYALGQLRGEFQPVHTEDIAIKCHKLFPDAFSWTKYPNIPDKDIVRVALTDARKEKYGAMVEGRAGQATGQPSKTQRKRALDGWILTESGVTWLRSEAGKLDSIEETRELRDHRQKALRRLRRVLEHRVFISFQEDPQEFSPSLGDLASLFRCRVDAPAHVWDARFADLARDATVSDKQGLSEFVENCSKACEQAR